MDKETDRTIAEFVRLVRFNYPGFNKAVLFGSFAKGLQHGDSDIDLALVFNKLDERERFDLQVQLMLLAVKIDSRIEPHPISLEDFKSGNPMAFEIRKTGIEVGVQT
jgi:uncharacterized protein